MSRVWDRGPRETDKAFKAFQTYLTLPGDRTIQAVATILGKSRSIISGWREKYDWEYRTAQYDAHESKDQMKRFSRQRIKTRERQANIGAFMQDQALRMWAERAGEFKEKASLTEITRLFEIGAKLERTALGEAEETETVQENYLVIATRPPRTPEEAAINKKLGIEFTTVLPDFTKSSKHDLTEDESNKMVIAKENGNSMKKKA